MSKINILDRGSSLDSSGDRHPISGILSRPKSSKLTAGNVYRSYLSTLNSSYRMSSSKEHSSKRILYQIGLVSDAYVHHFYWPDGMNAHLRVKQDVRITSDISDELVGLHKKYSNFSGRFKFMDLSAIGYILGVALASYSAKLELSCDNIRSGEPVNIRALGVRDDPVSAGEGCVFIPRHAALDECPGAFYALAAAANRCGSTVFTDVLAIDGNNRAILSEPTNESLALGCVHGIRILLNMYDGVKEGSAMAYAFFLGLNQVLSVVSHSDEGGIVRDLYRVGKFSAPYGGIYVKNVEAYTGVPVPSITSPTGFINLVDSILLKGAALSSICDPLVSVNGKLFPTVLTVHGAAHEKSGVDSRMLASGSEFKTLWFDNIMVYADTFSRMLGKMFSVTSSDDLVNRHISACLTHLDCDTNRHLKVGASIAPYFWIEPTSLVELQFRSAACENGFGCVAFTDCGTKYGTFEKVKLLDDAGGNYDIGVEMRSVRTSGLLIHLSMHPQNGLGNIVPRQFVSNMVHFSRDGGAVDTKRDASQPISQYMWGRGHSWIPHPAEMMYQGNCIGIRVQRLSYTEDLNLHVEHVPLPTCMVDEMVHFSVSRPEFVGVRTMLSEQSRVSRVRSFAADSLENARIRTMRMAKYDEGLLVADFDGNWFADDEKFESASLHDVKRDPISHIGVVVETKSDILPTVRFDQSLKTNLKTSEVSGRGSGVPIFQKTPMVHPDGGLAFDAEPPTE